MTTRVQLEDTGEHNDPEGGDKPGGEGRPEWLPEKFESPEQMAESYVELEKKLSQGDDGDDDGEEGSTSLTIEEGDDPDKAVEEAGLDMDALRQEMEENGGTLTDATFKKFEKAGIPRGMVEGYIEGQKALADQLTTTVFELAGGEEAFAEMTVWAKSNLSPARIQAFNSAVESGNMAAVEMAVESLRATYIAENGSAPNLERGNRTTSAGVQPFASNDEMVEAMSDRRYKTDPAYRKQIQDRLAAGM